MPSADVESILDRLISFETISDRSNQALCDYIVAYLGANGVTSVRSFPDATGTKSAILASIGDPAKEGIVLSAHTDVVPVEGQAWTSPPFEATRSGDRIVGRGTSDMKGFIAAVLASVPRFAACCTGTPIHLAFSYDEEIGCRGAGDLVAAIAALPARPALCVVGEPTGMRVGRAHKGKIARRISIIGRGGHSAMPHKAASALDAIVDIATRLREIARTFERRAVETGFEPPYSTLHIGTINSGDALNFVPDSATLSFELRFVSDADVALATTQIDAFVAAEAAHLRTKAPEAKIRMEEIISYPALETSATAPALRAVAEWAGDAQSPLHLSFGTEASLYAASGIPTVVCGPGDIGRAHKADEWIGRAELRDACAMLERLADACRHPSSSWLA